MDNGQIVPEKLVPHFHTMQIAKNSLFIIRILWIYFYIEIELCIKLVQVALSVEQSSEYYVMCCTKKDKSEKPDHQVSDLF